MNEIPVQTEQLDLASAEFLTALFEASPDAIVVAAADGKIIRVNARTESMFGYHRQELVGQKIETLVPERFRATHTGKRDSYVVAPHLRQMGAGLQLFGRCKDGSEIPIDIMLSPLRASQGLMSIAVVRDITERIKAEEILHRTEHDLRLLISNVKDYAIYLLDPYGNISSWNEGAERIKQFTASEIIGKHHSIFFEDEDIAGGKPEAELELARQAGRCEEEGWRLRKDRTRFWANIVITTIKDAAGNVIGFAKVTRDVTERKESDDRLRRLMQQREDFVATLTHDLKTPIFAAKQALSLFAEGSFGPVNQEQESILQSVIESNESMYKMVVTLLDVYRYDSGEKQLCFENRDIWPIVDKLVKELQPLARSREITLELEGDTDAVVSFDSAEIRRVLQNLIDNAMKFTPAGGSITVSINSSAESARITVKDSGKGISEEARPQLFQRFWAPPSSGRYYASTGLGLYLCRKIIEQHGGRIWFESEIGQGTSFHFALPKDASAG